MKLIAQFLGSLGQTFILASLYFLSALAISSHMAGPSVVLETEIFRDVFSGSSNFQTVARLAACAATFLYFLGVGKYLAPLVLRWLGTTRGLLVTSAAILGLFLIVNLPFAVISVVAALFGGTVFVDALSELITPNPYWGVLIIIAGIVSGMRAPLPQGTPEVPPELQREFDAVATGLAGMAARLEQALSSSLDIMSGGIVKVTFTYLGLNAMATAISASSPVSQALIFWIPLAIALRDTFLLYMMRVIYPALDKRTLTGGLLIGYLLAVLLISVLVLVVAMTAVNLIMGAPALDLAVYGKAILSAPLGVGLGGSIVVFIAPTAIIATAFFRQPENGE